MSIEVTFGGMSLDNLADKVEHEAPLSDGDMLYALNRQKARMLDRTARGVDVDGNAFKAYSPNGPFYFYPNRNAGRHQQLGMFGKKASAKTQRGTAARNFAKKVGGTRTRLGVKFASYGAFKSALGRSNVDLMGVAAPHMLQALVVKVTGAAEGLIGVYGKEADRGDGHNRGAGKLPKRRWFDWGNGDAEAMTKDLDDKQDVKLKRIFGS